MFFVSSQSTLVTNRRTDGRNYDTQDSASIVASGGKNGSFFTFMFAFFYHNLRLTYILPVLKTKPTPYCNFTAGFDFDHASSAACDFTSAYQISSKLHHYG